MKGRLGLLIKLAAAAAVLAVLVLALAPVVLKKYFPPEKIRSLLVSNAQKSLRREVRLGEVSLGLVRGLSVKELAVSEAPDFKAGTFVAVKSFSLRVEVLALLRRKIVVESVSADGLSLSVAKKRDGTFNFSDLAGSTVPAAGQAAGGAAAMSFEFDVGRASLSDAKIAYRDEAAGDSVTLSEVSAKVRNLRLRGPMDAEISLRSSGKMAGRSADGRLAFSGKVDLGGQDPEKFSAQIRKFSAEHSGLNLKASGSVKTLKAPKVDMKISLAAKGKELLEAQFEGDLTLPESKTAPAARGRFSLKTPGFKSADLQPLRAVAPVLALPAKLAMPELKVSGRLDWKPERVEFEGLKLETRHGSVEASGKVLKLDGPKPQPDLSFSAKLDLPELKAEDLPVDALPAGSVIPSASVEAKGRLVHEDLTLERLAVKTKAGLISASGKVLGLSSKKPKAELKLSAKLDIPEIRAADIPFAKLPAGLTLPASSLDAQVQMSQDNLAIDRFEVKTKAGLLSASGKIAKLSSPKPEADLGVSANLDLPSIRAEDVPFAGLPAGLVIPAASLDFKGAGRGDAAKIERLLVKTKAGTLEASGIILGLSSKKPEADLRLLAKLDLPEIRSADAAFLKLPSAFVSPAAAVEGDLRLKGDDLKIASLKVQTKAGTVEVSGTLRRLTSGKPEPDLNLAAKLDLPALTSADVPLPQTPPDLRLPASKWEADLSGTLDEVKLRNLRVILGKNDVAVEGKVGGLRSGKPLYSLLVRCRFFVLEELTHISPQTREMGLAGNGFFALGVTGKPGRPILEGKMLFRELGMMVAGLKLSEFTGTVSFDEKRVDVPNLKGKVAEGTLGMDLTIKNYAGNEPFVDLQARLDQFDLGKFFAAKASLARPEAAPEPGTAKPEEPARAVGSRGRFAVGKLIHPNAEARDLDLTWDLSGIAPDLKRLSGSAKIASTGGNFNNIGKLATQSPLVKVLLFPLLIVQKIGGIGGIRIFPDFNSITYAEIAGDYAFKDGVMTLRDSHLYSDAANVGTVGEIDLPAEKLALTVTAQVARVAPMDIEVTGTFTDLKTKVKVGKFISDIFQKKP